MENREFFQRQENIRVLTRFKNRIASNPVGSDFERNRNEYIGLIISAMAGEPARWDESCQINIGWIGESFIRRLSETNEPLTTESLDDIFALCYRFLLELYLSVKTEFAREFEEARRFATRELMSFSPAARDHIEYAAHEMPISIFKAIANSDSINSLKEFNKLSHNADSKREEWDKILQAHECRVDALQKDLTRYETAFNFVGLYQGFDELSKAKETEKKDTLFWLKILGSLVVIPLIVEVGVVYAHLSALNTIKDTLILSIVPTISLVAILVYYFRVILFNYKSAKSQLLQIELRKTLCRFIQHYSEYSSKIKEKDKESLSKFENIIFSAIVSDDDKFPSTYDGAEQIGNLIKAIKS